MISYEQGITLFTFHREKEEKPSQKHSQRRRVRLYGGKS
jgi:hypothetical protein